MGLRFFFSRERPSLSDGLGRQARIRPQGRGLAAGQLVSVLATGLDVLRLRPCSEPMSLAGIDGERKSGIDIRAEHVTVRRRRRFPIHSCIYNTGDDGNIKHSQVVSGTSWTGQDARR